MKKKGFTLIELLAVIVILAIIALIAVPMVLNIIEKSKVGALKSSLTGLIESADMYYANNQLKGENAVETIFDFEDGEQISGATLEYKGKIENGKLILHANGEVAACIDDGTHYAYRNKDDNEVTTGIGTCVYDGTTGDFSSNSLITDLRGKTLVATDITESDDGLNALIKIPEEGHYDKSSIISVPIETIKNNVSNLGSGAVALFKTNGNPSTPYYFNGGNIFTLSGTSITVLQDCTVQVLEHLIAHGDGSMTCTIKVNGKSVYSRTSAYNPSSGSFNVVKGDVITVHTTYSGNYGGNSSVTLAV